MAKIWINTLFYSSAAACTIYYPFAAGFLYRPAVQWRMKTQLLWPRAPTALWSLVNLTNGSSNHGLNWRGCACSLPSQTYNLSVTPFCEENYKLLTAGFVRLGDIALPSSVNCVIISRPRAALVAVRLQLNWEQFESSAGAHHLHSSSSPHARAIKALGSTQGAGAGGLGEEQEGCKSVFSTPALKTLRLIWMGELLWNANTLNT